MQFDIDAQEDRRRARWLKWQAIAAMVFSVTVVSVSWVTRGTDELGGDGQVPGPKAAAANPAASPQSHGLGGADRHFQDAMARVEDFLSRGHFVNAALIGLGLEPRTAAERRRLRELLFRAHLKNREASVLSGHLAHVRFALFTPDGGRVFSGASDKSGALWQVPSGKRLAALEGHTDKVWAGAVAPDGSWAVTAGFDGRLRIWETGSGQLRNSIAAHEAEVADVAVSADGRRLASVSYDGSAAVWAASGGTRYRLFTGSGAPLYAVAMSPDGARLVTAGGDGAVRSWPLDGAGTPFVAQGHDGRVTAVSFSKDGQWLLSAGADGTARLWDGVSGAPGAVLGGHTAAVNAARFSPDGHLAVTASTDGTARLWEIPSGRLLKVLAGHETWVNDVVFSADGKRIATASRDRTVRLWSVPDGAMVSTLVGHENDVISVQFSRDGHRLVTGSADGTIRLWNARNGVALQVGGTGERIKAGRRAYGAGGTLEVRAEKDFRISIIDRSAGTHRGYLDGHTATIRSVSLSPDGSALVSAADDGTVRLWSIPEMAMVTVLHEGTGPAIAVFKGDRRVLIETPGGRTKGLSVATNLTDLRAVVCAALPRRMTPYQRYNWGFGRGPVVPEAD